MGIGKIIIVTMRIVKIVAMTVITNVSNLDNRDTNHHVTPDLASMTSSEPYFGNDHLRVGDGKDLVISNFTHSKIHSLKRTFTLSNILHVPAIKKPLLSV